MHIYLAGPCDSEHRTFMRYVKEVLESFNCEVYAPFELKIENAWSYTQEAWSMQVFEHDIAALNAADAVIFVSYGRVSSAGSNWEQGYAFAKGIPTYILQVNNAPTSLMTYCGCTNFYNTTESKDDIADALRFIIQNHGKKTLTKKPCTTILT